MTEELKARIAQINAGTAPKGYKKTKVGIVPEEWEVTRFTSISQKTGSERNDSDCAYPVYSINNKTGFAPQGDQFENDGYSNTSKDLYRIVRKGEFAYNPARINVGSIGLLSDVDAVIISSLYVCFKLNDKCYNPYFWQYFKSHRFNFDVNNYTEGSVREYLFYDNFARIRVAAPPLPEQQKIAEILTAQDAVIALMQKQIELLQKQKKAFLQKMFPKKGCTVPGIRFAGFTDAWEQRKFGDLGSVAMCKRIFKEQTTTTGEIPFYKIGTFGGEPDAFISRELFEEYKAKFSYPEVGDMLISASGTIGRTVEYTGKDEYFQDSNIVWFKHDDRVDNSFLRCLYSIVEWSGIEGSTIKRLYNDNFLKTEFMLPCVEEQKKVGSFFSRLDTLITLHQRKLEIEQQKKKALMQLLLTGKVRVKT